MAYGKYTWGKVTSPEPVVPLVAPIDPQHSVPTGNPESVNSNPLWMMSGAGLAPTLDPSLIGDVGTVIGGGGPVDHTPDQSAGDHPAPIGVPMLHSELGVGTGPGLTTLEAQAIRGALMNVDFGAVGARLWQATTDRYDGSGPHVALLAHDVGGDGVSPITETNRLSTGVGAPRDGGVSQDTVPRQKRWWDRVIDMHRWGVEYRPVVGRNAYSAGYQPAVADGTQYNSPEATAATQWMGTQDRFVAPQERRSPVPWDQPLTTDGVSVYGDLAVLPVWGL